MQEGLYTCNCALWMRESTGDGMETAIFGLYALFLLLLVVGIWGHHSFSQALLNSHERLNEIVENHSPDVAGFADDMRAVVTEIVEDTLQGLEPPRAIDHIFGAVAQLIQARTMQMMNPQGLLGVAQGVMEHMTEDPEDNV